MQPRFKLSVLLAVITVLFLSSCGSKTNKEGRYIPGNAVFVFHINGKSLNSKLSWEEIKQNELFKQVYADSSTTAFMKSVMDNPDNTGIDVKNDIVFFASKDSTDGYVALEGTLKDAAKFKQLNLESSKNLAVESEKGGIHFLTTDKTTAAWDKEKFVFISSAPGMYSMGRTYGMNSSADRDLNAVASQIFALKEDNSLGDDGKFSDLMKTTGDIHFWFNIEAMGLNAENMPKQFGPLAMINFKKIYEGSRMTGTISFDNGKINADFKSYSNKEMSDLMKKYAGDKISGDMVKRIPSKNLAAFFALNFKPEGIREYLKLLGLDGFANMGERAVGFNLDDFIKANKGDIQIAVTDITKDSIGVPNASIIFSTSIGDKQSFNKLVEGGKRLLGRKFNGEDGPSVFYNMNETYFAIGNKKEDVDKYIGTANNSNPDFYDKISGSSGAFYVNIQYVMQAFGPGKDSLDILTHAASMKIWDNIISYGTGFKDGGSTYHVEINMLDKNTNSLKQLNSYLGEMGVIQKKRHQLRFVNTDFDTDKMADSLKVEMYKNH